MDRSEMRAELRLRTGALATDQLGTDANLNSMLNSAMRWATLQNPNGWPWLRIETAFQTADGTAEYDFNTVLGGGLVAVAKVIVVRIKRGAATYEELDRVPWATLHDSIASEVRGTPAGWTTRAGKLVFGPVPDGVHDLKALVVIDDAVLDDDTDEPLMPARFHDIIVAKAAERYCLRTQNAQMAQVYRGEAGEMVQAMYRYGREHVGTGSIHVTTDRIVGGLG